MNAGTCAHFWRGSCGESGVLQKNGSFLQIQNDHSCRWSMCWSSVHMCSRTGPVDWPTQLIFISYFYIAGQVPHVAAMCVQFCVHYVAKIIFRLSFSQNIKELVATATDMCSKTGPTCCSHPCVFNDSPACTQARMTHPDRTRYPAWRWSREHPETERSTHRWLCLKTLFWQKRDQKLNFYQTVECTNEAEMFTGKHIGWTMCANATIDSEFDI